MNATQHVTTLGQSLWLDNLSRSLIRDGTLARLIAEDGVSGVTSNPSIFQNALATSPYYADDLARLKASEPDAERRYEALVIPDIQDACDLLLPAYRGQRRQRRLRQPGSRAALGLRRRAHGGGSATAVRRGRSPQPADQGAGHARRRSARSRR